MEHGAQAVEAATRRRYGAILMYVHMPIMDGYQATAEIRKREHDEPLSHGTVARRVPIIALTANALAADRERVIDAGMDDFLSKPFRKEQLSRALARWTSSPDIQVPPQPSPQPSPLLGAARTEVDGVVLDRARLDEVRQLGPANNLLGRLVTAFLREATERVERLQTAAAGGDSVQVAEIAHYLVGSSASIGAIRLAALCRRIEQTAQNGTVTPVADLVASIPEELAAVRAALQAEESEA